MNEAQKLRLVEKIVARLGEDLAGPPLRAVGARVQAEHRRHARGAVARDHRGARRARRDDRRLRSGGDGRGAARVRRRCRTSPTPPRRWTRVDGADALVVVTEWKEFRSPDFDALRAALKQPLVFDGRNLYDPALVRAAGLEYFVDRPPLRRHAHEPRRARDSRPGATAIARTRVLVVGDVMLDRYWFGDVERISPEAPVPVVKIARTEERPGGAANVARNAAALGAQTTLLSVIGADEPGAALERLLAAERVQTSFHRDPALPTTVKLRVIGRQQQLLRIDFETAPSHEVLATKLADFDRLLADADLVILSDYGKGGLAHIATMIERARAAGKPVLVDPKGDDWDAVSRRHADHAQPRRVPRRSSAAGATRPRWRPRRRRCARELDARRRCSSRARRRG